MAVYLSYAYAGSTKYMAGLQTVATYRLVLEKEEEEEQ